MKKVTICIENCLDKFGWHKKADKWFRHAYNVGWWK
jgi:hypothetical protein